jgi:predicted Zn-dependent protease
MARPQKLVETALGSSTADECLVIAESISTANLRWANNTLTTNGVTAATDVSVISIVDGVSGVAAGVMRRGIDTRDQVRALVAEADDVARRAAPADDAGELVVGPDSDDWDAPPGATGIDVFDEVAGRLGRALRRASNAEQLRYGYLEHAVETTYLGTSSGLRLRHEQPAGYVTMTGKPADFSTSAWVGQATEQFDDVDIDALDAELVRRIGWAANRVELEPGRYETIVPPSAVADLGIYAYWVATARDASEGQSVYSGPEGGTRVGEQIVKPGVTIRSDPAEPGIACCPFVVTPASGSDSSVFDNGTPLRATRWVADGTLRNLMSSRHSARRTGLPFAPGIENLVIEVDGGAGSVGDLVASTERALLLTCLWYIREVDPQTLLLTGLTRDGVYLVEDGQVTGAVNNFRFNESPIDLLSRFTEAGESQRSFSREWGESFSRTITPALRVPDFNMSSVSPAS